MRNRHIIFVIVTVLVMSCISIAAPDQNNEAYDQYHTMSRIVAEVNRSYVGKVDREKLFQGAYNGMLQSLDPFSAYMPPEEKEAFDNEAAGEFCGLGIELTADKNGILQIIAPIEDTPAYKAGVLAGDRILKIENKSTRGMGVMDAIKLLRGEKGTPAVLQVIHENGDIETLTIVRDMIRLETVKDVRFADEQNKIGYIRLTQFQNNSTESLDKAVKELQAKGMKALVIDLRFNPGGMLTTAIEIADRFIDDGVIVSTKGRTQNEQIFRATPKSYPYFPVAILVGGRSASASEILAGAIQDHKRGVIVGSRTFGKGSVQTIIKLDDGKSAIRLTTAYYYTPSGKCIHHNPNDPAQKEWGIEPDITVPTTSQDEIDLWESWRERLVQAAKKNGKKPGDKEDPLEDFEELRQQSNDSKEKKIFRDAPLEAAINALKGAMLAENRRAEPATAANPK